VRCPHAAHSILLVVLAITTNTGRGILAQEVPVADSTAAEPTPLWFPPAARIATQVLPDTTPRTPGDFVRPVLGGVLGAAVGFLVGGTVGGRLENRFAPCHCDDPGLAGFIYGAAGGMTLTIPLGVHLFGGSRGRLRDALAGSLLGGALTISIAAMSGDAEVLLLVPVADLVGALAGEMRGR
jgi:hypothetical protein